MKSNISGTIELTTAFGNLSPRPNSKNTQINLHRLTTAASSAKAVPTENIHPKYSPAISRTHNQITPYLYSIPPEKLLPTHRLQSLISFNSIPIELKDLLLPPSVSKAILEITQDHDSGARQLALKALRALQSTIDHYSISPGQSPWRDIVNCAWFISRARLSMGAAIHTTLLRVLNDLQSHDPGEWNQILQRHISEEQLILEKLVQQFLQYFSMKSIATERNVLEIVTLSNSSTMLAALTELFTSGGNGLCINLTILESRPLLEGVILAKNLLPFKPRNVHIQLVTDASAAYFSQQADFILLGADQIDPKTGNVKNKIGSLALAKFAKGKVIVVTSTDKLASIEDEKEEEEENDAGEVTEQWPVKLDCGVRVRNVYFEWIEGDLIDLYITERGVLSHGQLSLISAEREDMLKVWDILY